MKSTKILGVLGAVTLLVAACGPAAEKPTPTPSVAPMPTSTPLAAPTPTPGITSTQVPTTPTPTPKAVATPTKALVAEPKHGGVATTYVMADPGAWDPYRTLGSQDVTRRQHNLVFDRLAAYPAPPENMCKLILTPELAEAWKWVNDTTLEVKLRKSIHFQNKPPVSGREMTAEDVKFSVQSWGLGPSLQQVWREIKDIQVVDRYTVRLLTNGPAPGIVNSLFVNIYGAVIVPPEAAAGPRNDYDDPRLSYIGTGPFMFVDYRLGVKSVYKRNPDYWRPGLPYLDGIELLVIPQASTRAAAVRGGKLNIWDSEMPIPIWEEFQARPGRAQMVTCPDVVGSSTAPRVMFRTDKAPTSDVRLRRAFSMAIDREAIVAAAYQGKGRPIFNAPPVLPVYLAAADYPPEIRKYGEYRPDEARALLKEAGLVGVKLNMLISPQKAGPYNATVEAIQDMVNKVGFNVTIDSKEYGEYSKLATFVGSGYPDLVVVSGGYADPYRWLSLNHSSTPPGQNKSLVNDPVMDRYIEEFMRSLDPDKAIQAAARIQIRHVEMMYWVMVAHSDQLALLTDNVRDFALVGATSEQNWAPYVWLDR